MVLVVMRKGVSMLKEQLAGGWIILRHDATAILGIYELELKLKAGKVHTFCHMGKSEGAASCTPL
jgi:hypothetical protein